MNLQNLRRAEGIREAFVPRAGRIFVQCDAPQLESYTWAQFCLGRLGVSKLAEALNAGMDSHLMLTATILKTSYDSALASYNDGDPEVEAVRQASKVENYGAPAGMGPKKLQVSMKKQLKPEVFERLRLGDLAEVERVHKAWKATWPEAQRYLDWVSEQGSGDKYFVESFATKRFRGGCTFCGAANNGFQALGADCMKNAGWLIAKAQYVEPESPLFNSRTVVFAHDEFILEADDTPLSHDCAEALADKMVEGANVFLPDVPMPRAKFKPCLMRRWSKKAKPLKNAEGRLIPWDDKPSVLIDGVGA